MPTVDLATPDSTRRLARDLAARLKPGLTIALTGSLGAGKTFLVRALAEALGARPDEVHSPTFTLVHHYRTTPPLRHCDTYRLRDAFEFDEFVEDVFEHTGVAVIEWADRVATQLPADVLWIALEPTGEHARRATLRGTGPLSQHVLAGLSHAANPTGTVHD